MEAGFSTYVDEIRSEDAMKIYDFFETVIEASLEDLSAFMLYLKREDEGVVVSMSVDCKTDLQEIAGRCGAHVEQDFDGMWLLSLTLKGGNDEC